MKTVDLSLDYDFFIREVPKWEFGHRDSTTKNDMLFNQLVWQLRYGMIDLYDETALQRHADFDPVLVLKLLQIHKGLGLLPPERRHIGIADSHRYAFDFFKQYSPPDFFINMDAHHDCWQYVGHNRPNCGNWLPALQKTWGTTRSGDSGFVQVYPEWKDPKLDGPNYGNTTITSWQYWPGLQGAKLRHIFLCRSPEWVPPHHDVTFIELLRVVCSYSKHPPQVFDTMYPRPAPTLAEARAARQQWIENWNQIQNQGPITIDNHNANAPAATPVEPVLEPAEK